MSHDTSLRQLLSSTGSTTSQEDSAVSLKANAAGGASGDVSLKKDFVVEQVGTMKPTYSDVPGATVYVAVDHTVHNTAYSYNIGQITLHLNMPDIVTGTYAHITAKLYDDSGSLVQTGTGHHGSVITFKQLDGGTEGFRMYTVELMNTNGGMAQAWSTKVFTSSLQPWTYDANNHTHWPQDADGIPDTASVGTQHTGSYLDYKYGVPSGINTTKGVYSTFEVPYIKGSDIGADGVQIPANTSITLSPLFKGEGGRFNRIKRLSTHYEFEQTSGSDFFTMTQVMSNGHPAVTLTSLIAAPGYVFKGNVRLRYSDEFNIDAINYNQYLNIPVTLLGGDYPGMAWYTTAEAYGSAPTYDASNDGVIYVTGIPGLTPTTTSWRITLLSGSTQLQQTTKSGTWFWANPVTFSGLDGDASYTVRVEDMGNTATREQNVTVGKEGNTAHKKPGEPGYDGTDGQPKAPLGTEAKWLHFVNPIHG